MVTLILALTMRALPGVMKSGAEAKAVRREYFAALLRSYSAIIIHN